MKILPPLRALAPGLAVNRAGWRPAKASADCPRWRQEQFSDKHAVRNAKRGRSQGAAYPRISLESVRVCCGPPCDRTWGMTPMRVGLVGRHALGRRWLGFQGAERDEARRFHRTLSYFVALLFLFALQAC